MINPNDMDAVEWMAQTTPLVIQYGQPSLATTEDDWRQWADTVSSFSALAALGITGSAGYDDWRQWAHKFNSLAILLNP